MGQHHFSFFIRFLLLLNTADESPISSGDILAHRAPCAACSTAPCCSDQSSGSRRSGDCGSTQSPGIAEMIIRTMGAVERRGSLSTSSTFAFSQWQGRIGPLYGVAKQSFRRVCFGSDIKKAALAPSFCCNSPPSRPNNKNHLQRMQIRECSRGFRVPVSD